MTSEIQRAQIFELQSLTDLIRLIVSRFDPSNRASYIYYGKQGDKNVFFTSQVVFGWYDLRGLPMTLVAYSDGDVPTNLIRYKSPTDSEEEKWEFVTLIENGPNLAHIPIIQVANIPEYIL